MLKHGLALIRSGKGGEAVGPLREYCSLYPGHREATLALGRRLAMQDELNDAIDLVESYCRQHSGDVSAHSQLGLLYLETGNAGEAWRIFDQISKDSTDSFDTLILNAMLLMFEGQYREARDAFERLIRLQQGTPDARLYILAAQACRETGDTDAAVAYARAAVKLSPNNFLALTALIETLMSSQDVTEARKWLGKAEKMAPHDPTVIYLRGLVLEFEGDKQGAWNCVQQAIEAGLVDIDAAGVMDTVAAAVGKVTEVIQLLESLSERPGLSAGKRRSLHFTLARACDKSGYYERAFNHAVIANRLKNVGYDHSRDKIDNDRLKAVYSSSAVVSLPRSGKHSNLPIFIVGMPRSGTSLMEQILSCHSQIYARGETADIGDMVGKIPYYPDGMRDIEQGRLDALADVYIQRLREAAPSAARITDKMPGNYHFLGFISQLLPGARIINCRRDPRDVCLSNFMIDFSRGINYAYDLESLAQVYLEYLGLMDHWKTVLSLPILDVRYEDLVVDLRTCVETVLDFCGLEWEDACLDFHKSKRLVATASYDQVRKPLYTSSIARWKHYQQYLEPVNRILDLDDDTYP